MYKRSFAFTVIVLLLVVCLLMVFCSACSGGKAENAGGDKAAEESDSASRISYVTTSHPGMIHIEWKPAKGAGQAGGNTSGSEKDDDNAKEGAGQASDSVSRYEIYRKDVTGAIYTSDDVPFEEYDKVGSVSGEQTDFDDKDVTNGHYYTYVVRGFDGDKIICDSFSRNVTQYECAGLAKPDLIDNGYGENNENSPKCLYLLVQIDSGMSADGIEICRRAKGEDKFSRIKPGKVQSEDDGYGTFTFEIEDTSVKPGNLYEYKVRTFVEENGERVESEYSDIVQMSSVNFIGQYKVSRFKIDRASSKVTLTLKSNSNNGTLKLDKGAHATLDINNSNNTDSSEKDRSYALTLDHKKVIKAGEKTKLTFTCGGKLPESCKPDGTLIIEDEGVNYDIGILGYTTLSLDLSEGAGTVFVDYDN